MTDPVSTNVTDTPGDVLARMRLRRLSMAPHPQRIEAALRSLLGVVAKNGQSQAVEDEMASARRSLRSWNWANGSMSARLGEPPCGSDPANCYVDCVQRHICRDQHEQIRQWAAGSGPRSEKPASA